MKSILHLLYGPPGLILLGAILTAIGALWASQQQVSFERHLRSKSEEIASLNREIVNLVTGGDSFCYIDIANIDSNTNRGILTVVHHGEHPSYDVTARIADLQRYNQIKKWTIETTLKTDTPLKIGNIPKGSVCIISPFDLGDSQNRDFNVFFTSRVGFSTQLLRMRKIKNKWIIATQVERNGEVLFEKVNDDFPKTEQGQVQW
ncbi:MAG: hypothetical protein ACYTFK_11875 [Planctomycetota bacterium]